MDWDTGDLIEFSLYLAAFIYIIISGIKLEMELNFPDSKKEIIIYILVSVVVFAIIFVLFFCYIKCTSDGTYCWD